jgi:hypothetical protein
MNQKVRLKSFNGSLVSPKGTSADENYWTLIGKTGEIVEPKNERGRVLVIFDIPVLSLGLACHNWIENSLYILESDLEACE